MTLGPFEYTTKTFLIGPFQAHTATAIQPNDPVKGGRGLPSVPKTIHYAIDLALPARLLVTLFRILQHVVPLFRILCAEEIVDKTLFH